MRVLITGITGYIGSNLGRKMCGADEVYGLVRLPLNTEYISDIQDRIRLCPYDGGYESMLRAVSQAKPDIIYHLATYYTGRHGADETPKLIDSNITLGAYLLEAMTQTGADKLIYTTTVMEHFAAADYRPLNLYAATKRACADLIAYYADSGAIRAVTLVLSDTYGPNDHRPKILNLIKNSLSKNEPIALSDGNQDFDLVYIDDVINALLIAGSSLLAGQAGGRYQVCADHPQTLKETVEQLMPETKDNILLRWGALRGNARTQESAVRLFPTVPGWKQKFDLETAKRAFT